MVQSSKFTTFVKITGMALNTFNSKIQDRSTYVYGLLDKDKVFYIGITDYIYYRYKQHWHEYLCSNYIGNMRIKGEYPNIAIYGAFKDLRCAEAAEHSLIRYLSSIGHNLCNRHQNPHSNVIKNVPVNSNDYIRMPNGLSFEMIKKAK